MAASPTALAPPAAAPDATTTELDEARRRYTRAAIVAIALAAPAYLSVLWGGRLNPLRTYYPYHLFANFYELQARALFHGHWYVSNGALGVEGFLAHGHEYTYFGPFPALLRMPLLIFTSRFDGRLTAPSMLLAWLVTALCLSLLLWRIRFLLRGAAPLGVSEATAYGAVIATALSGSVLLFLAQIPAVYEEDLAWGVATTLAALFALLGVLERPSRRRVLLAGAFILAAALARAPLGFACIIGAFGASGWFALGHGGQENRQWWRPLLATGLVPLMASVYVTWAKFGIPVGLPMSSQVWAKIDQHRRYYLAANGGKAFNLRFLPTTLLAYLRPDGIRLTRVFPFLTLPASPPHVLAGAVFDATYRTAGVPATMPLLFLLSVWGIITVFRPLSSPGARMIRIVVLVAGAGTGGALVWGYIANRYLADFVPLLCVASGVGVVDLFRRAEIRERRAPVTSRRRGLRRLVPGVALARMAVVLAVFGVVANIAISSTPTDPTGWSGARVQSYVRRQETISSHTGNPIAAHVSRGTRLPAWAPADQLFVLGQCSALYISDGEPDQTWVPVDFGPGLRNIFDMTLQRPSAQSVITPLVDIGHRLVSTVAIEQVGDLVRARLNDPLFAATGPWMPLQRNRKYQVTVDADTQLHTVTVAIAGRNVIVSLLSTSEDQVAARAVKSTKGGASGLTFRARPVSEPELCRNLI